MSEVVVKDGNDEWQPRKRMVIVSPSQSIGCDISNSYYWIGEVSAITLGIRQILC